MSQSAHSLADARISRVGSIVLLAIVLLATIALDMPVLSPIINSVAGTTHLFLVRQDLPLLPFVALPLLLLRRTASGESGWLRHLGTWRGAWCIGFAMLLLCWWGHYAILNGRDHSRDEQMAVFDASIFARGRLFWPIPVAWQPFAAAINQTFILPIGRSQDWVSAYLPVNAALRAVVGMVADPALTAPLFVLLGALSLFRVTQRVFPDAAATRAIAMIFYLSSSQILLMGMTSYAMSAHLGLNLLWLALFLRDDRRGHAGAIIVAWFATGLHQPLFHPLFALPFMGLLWRRRAWRVLLTYALAYLAIGAFWMAWPIWVSGHVVVPAATTSSVGYVARLQDAVGAFTPTSVWLMSANLLRFLVWQHLLLVPMLLIGVVAYRRETPLVRAMAISFALPVVVMAVILPEQGHGWGYRYMHGVLGNACLLGAFGWHWLDAHDRAPRRAMTWATLGSTLFMFPVHAWMAHETTAPAAAIDHRLAHLPAAIAIIDNTAAPYAADVILNRPDLSNRPIRLKGGALVPTDMPTLCRMGKIAFVDGPALGALDQLYGLPTPEMATPHQHQLIDAARHVGCTIVPID